MKLREKNWSRRDFRMRDDNRLFGSLGGLHFLVEILYQHRSGFQLVAASSSKHGLRVSNLLVMQYLGEQIGPLYIVEDSRPSIICKL